MKRFNSDKRNYIILLLCIIVLAMASGYAAFLTRLTINGTAKIASNWCVGFDSTKIDTYQITKGVANAQSPSGEINYSGTACSSNYVQTATLNSDFYQPGDKIVFTLTIANKGSLDASINSITLDGTPITAAKTVTKGNIKYTVTMPTPNTLVAGTGTATIKVTAEFQNDTDISEYSLAETQTITVGITAVQYTG